jgi:substrate-binding family protein
VSSIIKLVGENEDSARRLLLDGVSMPATWARRPRWFSTINGDANVPFYKELGNQGVKAKDIPVVAFSVGEEELAGLERGTSTLAI